MTDSPKTELMVDPDLLQFNHCGWEDTHCYVDFPGAERRKSLTNAWAQSQRELSHEGHLGQQHRRGVFCTFMAGVKGLYRAGPGSGGGVWPTLDKGKVWACPRNQPTRAIGVGLLSLRGFSHEHSLPCTRHDWIGGQGVLP